MTERHPPNAPDELTAQPDVTDEHDVSCPECGGEPTDDSARRHLLSAMGYLHDDQEYTCQDCGETWYHGVPVGDDNDAHTDHMNCPACGGVFAVHRVEITRENMGAWLSGEVQYPTIRLHLKCPDCYYVPTDPDPDSQRLGVTIVGDDRGDRSVAMVGNPLTVGDTEHADASTYPPDDSVPCGEPLCIDHGHGTVACPGVERGDSDGN